MKSLSEECILGKPNKTQNITLNEFKRIITHERKAHSRKAE